MTTIVEEAPIYPRAVPQAGYLAWTPAVAGALIATALSTILIGFGTAIGLGVASSAPTWRDASVGLWLLSGIYLILVALISFGVGGYAAGRIRANTVASDTGDIEQRDGIHGLAAWAIAVVLTVFITALLAGATVSRSPSTRTAPPPARPSRCSAMNSIACSARCAAIPMRKQLRSVLRPGVSY